MDIVLLILALVCIQRLRNTYIFVNELNKKETQDKKFHTTLTIIYSKKANILKLIICSLYRNVIKASIILLQLLDLIWLFGLLAVNENTSFWLEYLFFM